MKQSLATVRNRQGRIDVLLYQLADRMIERLERERGVIGIRERFMPMVEEAIVESVPRRLPREWMAFLEVCEMNRRRTC
jgi:hypothetical protein